MGTVGGECGIGLKVERTTVGYVITGLKHKYPAHLQGVLKVGYLIVSVDDVDLSNSMCALSPLVLGQEGAAVRIGYIRAPGEEVRHVDVVRGGGGVVGGRSVSSLSVHPPGRSSLSVSAHNSSQHPLPPRPHTASSVRYEGPESDAGLLDDVPAMRIDTGAASAMELRTYTHSPAEAPGESQGERRRSRSVALLPSSGPKRRYIPPSPAWHLDLRPSDARKAFASNSGSPRRPLSQGSDWTMGSESALSPGRSSADITSRIVGLAPSAVKGVLVGLPREEDSSSTLQQDSGTVASMPNSELVTQEELDEQQEQALLVFSRTPEGKIWKAEQARQKHEAYLRKRSEWASNDVLREVTGGKFSTSRPKSEFDWVVHFAKQLPGPGAHNPILPPREGRKDIRKVGTKFGTASRFGPDTIDHDIPGAGTYSPQQRTFSTEGGRFNGSDKVTAMELDLRQIADLPGPGEYDNYDREHRDVHLTRLAGKFSETTRMGRDLAMAEAARVHSATCLRARQHASHACSRMRPARRSSNARGSVAAPLSCSS
jgi:hypothetical protein